MPTPYDDSEVFSILADVFAETVTLPGGGTIQATFAQGAGRATDEDYGQAMLQTGTLRTVDSAIAALKRDSKITRADGDVWTLDYVVFEDGHYRANCRRREVQTYGRL